MPREQEIQRAAQTVDIGPRVRTVAIDRLLGRQIVGRAEHVLVILHGQAGVVIVGESGQPQVEDLDDVPLVDQQVGRLDVAMDQPVRMGIRQALGRLADVVGRAA